MKKAWMRVADWARHWWTMPQRFKVLSNAYFLLSEQKRKADARVMALGRESAHSRDEAERLRAALAAEGGDVPGLSPGEIERLAWFAEECGEAIQAAGKVLRHGYQGASPFGGPTNRVALEREIGHLRAAIDSLTAGGDTRAGDVRHWRQKKATEVHKWMVHQG